VNSHVLANSGDVLYLGAGGTWVPGEDGVGYWLDGEEMRGNTLTTLGDFGYKQYGWRESPCVLGGPIAGLGIKFPILLFMEYDGLHPYDQNTGVWNNAACPVASSLPAGTCFPIGGSGGLPYGPTGASANFLLLGFGSGFSPFMQAQEILVPNNGLQGTSSAGTLTPLALASDVALGIGSTGLCWMVTFNWVPSAVPALDDIDGWYKWTTSSPDNNQYYVFSDDEQNIWQSNTVAGGPLGLFAFLGNVEIEAWHSVTTPTTNYALAPNGLNATAPYAAMGGLPFNGLGPEYPPFLGFPAGGLNLNAGWNLGRHGGISMSGVGGAMTESGFGGQDPTPGGFANVPAIGFVTWNGGPATYATGDVGDPRSHVTWVQTWFDSLFAGANPFPPSAAGDPGDPANAPDFLVGQGGGNRFPLTAQEFIGHIFPDSDVAFFSPIFLTPVQDQATVWLDPYGFGAGAGGTSTVIGSSVHVPVGGTLISSAALGLPVGVQVGTSQLKSFMGPPLIWNRNANNPQENAVGTSTIIPMID